MLLILLLIVAISLLVFLRPKHKKNEPFNPPPGPKGLPLIGNLYQFDSSNPHIYFAGLVKIYGPMLSFRLGRRSMVVVQSAAIAKEVLVAQHDNFCNRCAAVGAKRLSYNRLDLLFAPFDDHFKEMKKIFVVNLLSSERMHSFAPLQQEEISKLIQKIGSLSSANEIINLSELIVRFATSKICRIAFGKRYESDEGSRSRFHSLLNEAQAMFASFFVADYFPYLAFTDKLTGTHSRLEKLFKKLDVFYEDIINDHKKKPKCEKENFIDILLHLMNNGSFSFELTIDHIKATIMNIFLGGTDTSIAMTIWTMTELMRNPNAMKKVQQELRNSIPNNKGYILENDLSKLKYFKAMVKETFRLHPATPLMIPRETLLKTTIEVYDLLPKTLVTINIWAIGRDPKIWKDPNLFIPERFIENSINFLGQDFELIPFGAGKRVCPGLQFGVVGLEILLANMLYYFDWEIPSGLKKEDIDIDVKFGVVMHKKNPLCLMAKKFSQL